MPQSSPEPQLKPPKIKLGGSQFYLPRSRIVRLAIGVVLILGGLLGFLPVLGFWMIPLGFLVLSVDLPGVRRWRRRVTLWWARRKGHDNGNRDAPAANDRNGR